MVQLLEMKKSVSSKKCLLRKGQELASLTGYIAQFLSKNQNIKEHFTSTFPDREDALSAKQKERCRKKETIPNFKI